MDRKWIRSQLMQMHEIPALAPAQKMSLLLEFREMSCRDLCLDQKLWQSHRKQ